eukprot:5008514-Pleurochrysis_carterae.AAC.1
MHAGTEEKCWEETGQCEAVLASAWTHARVLAHGCARSCETGLTHKRRHSNRCARLLSPLSRTSLWSVLRFELLAQHRVGSLPHTPKFVMHIQHLYPSPPRCSTLATRTSTTPLRTCRRFATPLPPSAGWTPLQQQRSPPPRNQPEQHPT